MGRIVGIDLGTTHTVVAHEREGAVCILPIPQLATPTEIQSRPLFPSCLYAPAEGEHFADPWGDAPWIAGELARRRGGDVPGRLVSSAKSWLCHGGVDRTAAILPWGAHDDDPEATSAVHELPRISPVDASALFLRHVKRAYEAAFPGEPLDEQDVVLTVPASFDEVARELTVLAATRAGLRVRLLEEPQAAFYDFLHRAGLEGLEKLLADRDEALVLVCDVGGGTTDLSLIKVARTREPARPYEVTRVAVGQHLLLGGDNMDLALAMLCESRMQKLDSPRFGQLVAACRAAKERLLSEDAPDDVAVSVLGRGSALVGGALSTRLTRAEVERVVLDGFFPEAPRDARPERAKSALVAFGLPYERDAAITRHLAWFFARHAEGAHPHALLLNGGVFRGARVAQRLAHAIEAWGGPLLQILEHHEPDLGVARGAVAYGLARRGQGLRIEGGAARGYYVGLDTDDHGKRRAICVVPRGAKEGVAHVAAGAPLALVVGTPVRFDLFASQDARVDLPGAIVAIDDDERFSALPPVAVSFDGEGTRRSPRASSPPSARGQQDAREVRVALEGELTPIGTLDLACVEVDARSDPPRRFRLAFQLRASASDPSAPPRPSTPPPSTLSTRRIEQGIEAIERVFGKPRADASAGERDAKDLVRELERILGERSAWTTNLARTLFDALLLGHRARRRSADHERVFWMLAGFCVRPGFGDPLDAKRTADLASLFAERLAFPESPRGWQQFWIAWRRAAGGLDEAAQTAIRDVIDPFLAPPERGLKRPKKLKPEALGEMLDMAASLERIAPARRSELGGWILERTWTDRDPRLWTALGRLGARVPAYASVHHVVSKLVAERWLDHILREKWDQVPAAAQAAVQLARVTDDRARDVSDRVRSDVEKKLVAIGARADWVRAVREMVPVEESERAAFFGEQLPVGLKLLTIDASAAPT